MSSFESQSPDGPSTRRSGPGSGGAPVTGPELIRPVPDPISPPDWDDDEEIELELEFDDENDQDEDDDLPDEPLLSTTPSVPAVLVSSHDGWPDPVQVSAGTVSAGDDMLQDDVAYIQPGALVLSRPRGTFSAPGRADGPLPLQVLWVLLAQSVGIAAAIAAMASTVWPGWVPAARFVSAAATVGLSAVASWLVARRHGPYMLVAAGLVAVPLMLWLAPKLFLLLVAGGAAAVVFAQDRHSNG